MGKSGGSTQSMERVLKIDTLFTEGVIIDSADEIEQSLMSREYHQAGEMVCRIVKRNEQLHSWGCLESQKRPKNTGAEKVENIISFVGERGMGKTSVMRSFMEFLTYENTGRESVKFLLRTGGGRDLLDSVYFVPLRYIDASVLKSSEDVMEIILARMFRYVRELIDESGGQGFGMADREETRALFRQFERVYQAIMTLNEKSEFEPGESALLRLQSLNSSFSLADSFQALVESFLKFTAESRGYFRHGWNSCARTPYLVIALDDVDRYMPDPVKGEPRKGVYTLLGQIDEYLKIPGVIVLMTYDDALLKINCRTYIKEKYKLDDADAENHQVEQYLTKIIPARQKIYMPNLAWKDSMAQDRLQIEIEKRSSHQPFPKVKEELENGGEPFKLSSKELTLCYLAEQYGCFFDAGGQKKHFFEEQNLRRLTDLVLALQLREQEKEENYSYSKLISYIYNHFSAAVLTGAEAALFSEWMEKTVDRRSRDIINYIRSQRGSQRAESGKPLENRDRDRDKELDKMIKEVVTGGRTKDEKAEDDWRYSYGELLYNLYQSTRTEGGKKRVFSKKMVQCILASYSVVLPYLDKNDETVLLKRVIGSSVAGQWANEFFPKIVVKWIADGVIDGRNITQAGACDIRGVLNAYVRIQCTSFGVIDELCQSSNKITELYKQIGYLIPAIELFSMFFTELHKANKPCKYGWYWEKEGINDFSLGINADSACFNIFNFVVNSFDPDTFFEDVDHTLCSLIGRWGIEEKEAKKIISQCSLKGEYTSWREKYGHCAMPFQHFDMMYNIMKRQQNNSDNRFEREIEPKDFLKQCTELYNNISTALEKQDDFYNKCLSGAGKSKFQEIYDSCPFIDYICGKLPKKCDVKNRVKELLEEFLISFFANLAKAPRKPDMISKQS